MVSYVVLLLVVPIFEEVDQYIGALRSNQSGGLCPCALKPICFVDLVTI